MSKPLIHVAEGVAVTAIVTIFFLTTSIPFMLSLVLLSVYTGWVFFRWGGRKHREIWINLAVIFLIIAMFEGLLLYIEHKDQSFKTSEILDRVYESEPDTLLGWKLIPNTSRTATKTVNGEVIYNVKISIDNNGRRITPECRNDSCATVLFFGDSFTYGEGVDDSLTLPWLFAQYTHQQYRVENLGVFGYGPQHMLAAIERGDVNRAAVGNVQQVVYQLLYPEHLYRLAGTRSWDISGPQYVLNRNGEAAFSGDYFTSNQWLNKIHNGILSKSAIFRKLFSYSRPIKQSDKTLFLAIAKKSFQLLKKEHPSARFHILVWDWTHGEEQEVFRDLSNIGIELHFVNSVLPKGISALEYKLHPFDRHPNGEAYQLFAKYLADRLHAINNTSTSISFP